MQKLLHVSKRSRLDLQVGIGCLCTRVKDPRLQDWMKLRRMLQYIRGTIDLRRIVSLENNAKMDIYIDAAHATHQDFKGQTGGCVIMGDGVIHARSNKQKLNTKSSTESELVGNSDYMPYALWLLYFYQEQGYVIAEKRLHQDNQSTMKMLKNGKSSCWGQSRHVNIRYFWVVDRLKEMSISVEFCPTLTMVSDFFTKALQGSLFRRMRDVVQGIQPRSILEGYDKPKEAADNETTIKDEKEKRVRFKNVIEEQLIPHRKERVEKIDHEKVKGNGLRKFVGSGLNCVENKNRTYASVLKSDARESNIQQRT